MKVTPLDIRRKEFKRAVRGYADEEVDLFLDEVADEFERLHQEIGELQERIRKLDEQVATHVQLKDALEKTLVGAQFHADETKANARKEAELILRDAELKARGIVSDSYSEVQRVQQALVQLKHLEEDFRYKFRSLLEGHLKLLAEAPIDLPAGQAVMADPALSVAEPAASAMAPAGTSALGAIAATPFVVPAAIEEVPEYPPVAARAEAPVQFEEIAPVAASFLGGSQAPVAVESQSFGMDDFQLGLLEAPIIEELPIEEAPVLWSRELSVAEADDTGAPEQDATLVIAEPGEDVTRPDATLEPLAGMRDESVTQLSGEDPLAGFFFAPGGAAADGFPAEGKDGKSKPRDFEW